MTDSQADARVPQAAADAAQTTDRVDATPPAAPLPRVPRTNSGNRSYCAETAWVWQRARLVIASPGPAS